MLWDGRKSQRREMTWCSNSNVDQRAFQLLSPSSLQHTIVDPQIVHQISTITCPSCGNIIPLQDQGGIHNLPGLPAGVKFDPSDQEILQHLEAKALCDARKLHPLIDEFIPTLEDDNGICYTHPEKLPGVNRDGLVRHFFHRPSKAYTTGTRKRRKVHADGDGGETRWHKTGKTRPVLVAGAVKGFKKILVLYANYGRQRKPEKTNWVMHQYHLGHNEEEKDGELVASKVFYQTQPRQCSLAAKPSPSNAPASPVVLIKNTSFPEYYNHSLLSYEVVRQNRDSPPPQLIPNMLLHPDQGSSFLPLTSLQRKQMKT